VAGVWKQRLNVGSDVAIGVLAIASFLCGMAFVAICAERGVYSLAGWNYQFEPISHYLHVADRRERILSWDKSWLLAGIALATGCLASWIGDFRQWLNKTPEQRRADAQAERDRLSTEQASKKERAAMRKQNRKPMSGWRRLWIVLSVIFGALAFTEAWHDYSHASAWVAYDGNSVAFWARARADEGLRGCDVSTMRTGYQSGNGWWVSCDTSDPFTPALLWFFAPGMAMAVIGLTVRWIWRGFRPRDVGTVA
jgi:hypothetical protein